MKCKNCGGTGNIANGMWVCCECDGTGFVDDNEEWFSQLPTKEKAEVLAKMCVAAVRDFEWSETKRCSNDYWVRWLKEKHDE